MRNMPPKPCCAIRPWPPHCTQTVGDEPGSVTEVLEWAGEPLATQEVAVVCGLSALEAREELGRAARMTPLGTDGFWSVH